MRWVTSLGRVSPSPTLITGAGSAFLPAVGELFEAAVARPDVADEFLAVVVELLPIGVLRIVELLEADLALDGGVLLGLFVAAVTERTVAAAFLTEFFADSEEFFV